MLALIIPIDSQVPQQDDRCMWVPRQVTPRVCRQILEAHGCGSQRVVPSDLVISSVVEHKRLSNIAVIVLPCPLMKVGIKSFFTARESGSVVVTTEPLDPVAVKVHALLSNKLLMATSRRPESLIRCWRMHQSLRECKGIACGQCDQFMPLDRLDCGCMSAGHHKVGERPPL